MDSERQIVQSGGEPGELLLAGLQLAAGYWRDRSLTDELFITLDGTRWYRSGDLARQDEDGCFHHLGRTDNQIQIEDKRIVVKETCNGIKISLLNSGAAKTANTAPTPKKNTEMMIVDKISTVRRRVVRNSE